MDKVRVLIVDADERFKRQMIWALKEDYELFEAQNRQEALKYIDTERRPSVILLDLHLQPGHGFIDEGLKVLSAFKEKAPEVKVIIVTANSEEETISKAKQIGADGYIAKPFKINFLKSTIKKILSIERRKYCRVECEFPIGYWVIKTNIHGKSRTINVSKGGVMFPVGQSVGVGDALDLWVSLPPKVIASGRVKWIRSINGVYYIGVQFVELTEENKARLAEHIYK